MTGCELSARTAFAAPFGGWYFPASSHEEAAARIVYLSEHGRPGGFVSGVAGVGKSLLLTLSADELRRSRHAVWGVDLAGAGAKDVLFRTAKAAGLSVSAGESETAVEARLAETAAGVRLLGRRVTLMLDHVDRCRPEAAVGLQRLMSVAGGVATIIAAGVTLPTVVAEELGRYCELAVRIRPLSREELSGYLSAAIDCCDEPTAEFDDLAADRIYELTGGVPGAVDRLASLAIVAANASDESTVAAEMVDSVVGELTAVPTAA